MCSYTLFSQPQCVPVTTSTCAAVFPQSYYILATGREENETFAEVTEISRQLDLFCSNALFIYACFYIHPPCDRDGGKYLLLCIKCTFTAFGPILYTYHYMYVYA